MRLLATKKEQGVNVSRQSNYYEAFGSDKLRSSRVERQLGISATYAKRKRSGSKA